MIRCSAPLPEGLDNPVLEKMLEPSACLMPSKEDEGGGNKEGESGPPLLPIPTKGMSASAREDTQREESDILSPRGRKRTTSEDPETKVSKREKKSQPEGPASEGILAAQCPRGDQPCTEL